MQREICNPRIIREESTGLRWFYLRRDGRYHRQVDDRGRWPSEFYNEFGRLRQGYKSQ